MKRKYLLVIFVLLILETLVLSTLALKIVGNKLKILGISHTIELNQNAFDQNTETSFEGFYEPKIGAEEGLERTYPEWLKTEPVYHINSDGFNDRFDYQINKPEDTFRIITLGDSFTFGQYVDVKDNYPERLEDLLNKKLPCGNVQKFEVINLGVPGYDLEFGLARFRLRGQKYGPDMVLIFLKDDDFEDLREFGDLAYNQLSKQARMQNLALDLKKIRAQAYEYVRKTYSEKQVFEYHQNALSNFRQIFANKLVIFTLPSTSEKWKKLINDFVKSNKNTFYFENLTDINKLNQALPDTHPNPQGYKTIAGDLENFISQRIKPCN